MPDAVTMDKIVSLARRRGFVFPSSEIYGGLASSYDYGHYGVLLKENVKARWFEAMVRERDDIVALDSSIILHPAVWEASGHVAGFADPLVDCRFCKRRYRADQLDQAQCGQKPSKHPGETDQCDLTEPRQFNLMFSTRIGPVEETGQDAFLRPETAQGIFINFKNVAQIARRKPPFGIAQIGKAFRNEITPGNFIFRTLEFEQMEMEYFVPPGRGAGVVPLLGRAARSVAPALRDPPEPPSGATARRRGALALLLRHERPRIPLPDRLVGARGGRAPRRLRPHRPYRGVRDEARVGRRRGALHAARRRAGARREPLAAHLPGRRLRRGGRRRARADRAPPPPALAPVKAAILPLIPRNEDMVSKARALYEELRRAVVAEYDDSGQIGRRYRRQDEIGTPYALTIDEQTLEDDTVTIRDRDSLAQERIPISGARAFVLDRLAADWKTPKPD